MAVILFVEDDAVSRRSIAHFLRLSGYEVHEADNGDAALSLLAKMQFDVVISDLNLPGKLNGIDILDALKSVDHNVEAILITGRGSEEVKNKASSLGADYLEKPIQLRDLEDTLQRRVGR
jgi:DNA-binding response OmpR family regulator